MQNANPMRSRPKRARCAQGFGREDLFVCVHEQFMTETARLRTSCCRRRCSSSTTTSTTASGTPISDRPRKLFEPLCRLPHQPRCDLRAGAAARRQPSGLRDDRVELIDDTLRASGWPEAETIRRGWVDCDEPASRRRISSTASRRRRQVPLQAGLGEVRPRPCAHADAAGPFRELRAGERELPFRLVAAPARTFLNTTFTETPTRVAARASRAC